MTKIKCLNCHGVVSTQTYTTPKGNKYEFHQGSFTPVDDPEDALNFLKAVNGEAFVAEEGPLKKIGKKLEADIKKLLKKDKEVNEDEAPEETGELEPNAEDLAAAEGDTAPIDGEEENSEGDENVPDPEVPAEDTEEEHPVNEDGTEGRNVYTFEGLKELNARSQTYMIKQIQGEDAKVPRLEKDKIELLLKLQEEGAKLFEILKGFQE